MPARSDAPTLDGLSPVWRDERQSRASDLPHQPALDGVRGLSVLLVLLFHGGWSWMGGGYVGVSVFFTLSGFLITRLLLREHELHGRIDVVHFWGRRMRRLLPASMACLLAVAILGSLGGFGEVPSLGRELIGAMGQVANWVQLAGDVSYSDQVLGRRSPLDHYWSLAIEEQFYLLWPLVVVAIVRCRRPDRVITRLAIGAIAAAPLVGVLWGSDAVYWSTPARIGEILVGAALAATLARGRRSALGDGRHLRPALAMVGVPALAVILWAAIRWPSQSGPAYVGWLPVLALASAGLILALQVRSPLRRALSVRPLAGLGAISYGVYLYHWPIFLLVEQRVVANHTTTFAIQIGLTLVTAIASYRYLEHPIRRGRGTAGQLLTRLAIAIVAVLAIVAVGSFGARDRFSEPAAAASQLQPVDDLAPLTPPTSVIADGHTAVPASQQPSIVAAEITDDATATTVPTVVPDEVVAITPDRPVRVLVIGDSTAWSIGDGLAEWSSANQELAVVTLAVSPGCGFILEGRVPEDDGAGYAEQCQMVLQERMMVAIRDLKPDVALLMATRTDVKDREWAPDEGVLTIHDERFQARHRRDYRNMTDWILGAGVPQVVWAQPPVIRPDPAPANEMTDPARLAVLHEIIADTVSDSDPARVHVLELAAWYATSGIDDHAARIDGMHFEVDAAAVIAERFVGPRLVNVAVGAS